MYSFKLLFILLLIPSFAFAFSNLFNFGLKCFRCNLFGNCISYSHVCDGDIDCENGEDERNCPFICPYPIYYRCSDNGMCIHSGQLCNGIPDCMNGEDELPEYCYNARSARSIKAENLTDIN